MLHNNNNDDGNSEDVIEDVKKAVADQAKSVNSSAMRNKTAEYILGGADKTGVY